MTALCYLTERLCGKPSPFAKHSPTEEESMCLFPNPRPKTRGFDLAGYNKQCKQPFLL